MVARCRVGTIHNVLIDGMTRPTQGMVPRDPLAHSHGLHTQPQQGRATCFTGLFSSLGGNCAQPSPAMGARVVPAADEDSAKGAIGESALGGSPQGRPRF